jgi:hypothetical protein
MQNGQNIQTPSLAPVAQPIVPIVNRQVSAFAGDETITMKLQPQQNIHVPPLPQQNFAVPPLPQQNIPQQAPRASIQSPLLNQQPDVQTPNGNHATQQLNSNWPEVKAKNARQQALLDQLQVRVGACAITSTCLYRPHSKTAVVLPPRRRSKPTKSSARRFRRHNCKHSGNKRSLADFTQLFASACFLSLSHIDNRSNATRFTHCHQ